jgi:hypothetical protein
MKKRAFVTTVASCSAFGLLVGVGITALMEPAGAGYGASARYETNLTAAAEVPGPGDPDGTAVAAVKVKQSKYQVCVVIKKVKNLNLPATGAHIHHAVAGQAGPIVLNLIPPTSKKPGKTGKSKTCVTASPALVLDLIAYPADYYVNVHTSQFPDGALRGQLA